MAKFPVIAVALTLRSSAAFVVPNLRVTLKSVRHYDSNGLRMASQDDGPRNRRDVLKTIPSAAAMAAIAASSRAHPATAAADPDLSYLGPLAALVGTWSGSGGLSVTAVPSRNSKPSDEGAFELIVRPYKEILTFEAIPGAVKQRGGNIEQFSGVVTYNQLVIATDDDPGPIHVENGMLFYLDDVQLYSDGTPGGKPAKKDKPPFSIARSATVPHGNSAMLFGNYKTSNGPPTIPDISALPFPAAGFEGYNDLYKNSIYNAANPNRDLQKAVADQKITKTTHIELDSRNQGAVTNTDFVKSRADTTGFKTDFWVETVKGKDGKSVEQLQYSEFVDILFHVTEGGELIDWPHVMINTLTKGA